MTVIIRYNPDLIPHKAVLGSGCTELTFSVLSWLSVLLSFHHRPTALFFLSFQCTLSGNSVISKTITVFSSSSSPFPLTRFHLALLVRHFTRLTIVFLKLSAPSALVRPHSRVPPTNLVAYSQSLVSISSSESSSLNVSTLVGYIFGFVHLLSSLHPLLK